MEDWKEKIKANVDAHRKRRDDVTNNLNTMLGELKEVGVVAHLIDSKEYPLSWTLDIAGKRFEITDMEIQNKEFETDEWYRGKQVEGRKELKEALQELLVKKYED
ncbi:hypothetical protein [Brevibacillus borstelensis]|uniref:hypothetical protein n=1 Tax=Brevibacillus borstelensis TaxID=45462 RepID=UPI0030C40661